MAKRRDVDNALVRADELLCRIGIAIQAKEALEAEYNAQIEKLKAEYEPRLAEIKDKIASFEKSLFFLLKTAKLELFDGRDAVYLKNGALFHRISERVTIPRDALTKCEEMGFWEAIRIVKSLNREVVERWPDEKLFLIGAERKAIEKFDYDVRREK
ncbi:MAG TPA: host-nuclease inhibitor Gam family protein [Methanothrix sp.]|nr:host-nuclease inhibitor Gam family protein [Methanothrix sp.]HOL44533.1 host-nuclease inhibitor Gam family protein [Methanothrix sp.]